MTGELPSRSLSDRIVLLCLVDLEQTAQTPVHTGEVVREMRDLLDSIEQHLLDSLSEAAVNRALNRLEADGFVEMASSSGTSPTGKGRPEYTLDADTDDIVEALAGDEEVAPLASRVHSH
jgi:predicted transcriptional regulator